MRIGSLFSGIGGFDLGFSWAGFDVAWQCEQDPFCLGVLAKHWPEAKRYPDARTLDPRELEPVDVLAGGYPCQPFSVAGQRRGSSDPRHLWPEALRIVRGLRPAWCIWENVRGHITLGLDRVLTDLENEGYACRTYLVPACAVDAPHRRERVWIVAHAGHVVRRPGSSAGHDAHREDAGRAQVNGRPGERGPHGGAVAYSPRNGRGEGRPEHDREGEAGPLQLGGESALGYAYRSGPPFLRGVGGDARQEQQATFGTSPWANSVWLPCPDGKARRTKPGIRLLVDGFPGRVARLKALGNALVPQIAYRIAMAIITAEDVKPGQGWAL